MPPPAAPSSPSPPTSAGKGIGVFAFGCLLLVGLIFLAIVAIGGGTFFYLKKKANEWTSTQPAQIPIEPIPETELQSVESRFKAFQDACAKNAPAKLELTDREINGLIAQSPNFKEVRGRLHTRIEKNRARVDVSFPLDKLGINFGGLQGRFLNASMTMDVKTDKGRPVVLPQEITVDGRPLPKEFTDSIRQGIEEQLKQQVQQGPSTATESGSEASGPPRSQFKDIHIENDRLLVEVEPSSGGSPSAAPGASETSVAPTPSQPQTQTQPELQAPPSSPSAPAEEAPQAQPETPPEPPAANPS